MSAKNTIQVKLGGNAQILVPLCRDDFRLARNIQADFNSGFATFFIRMIKHDCSEIIPNENTPS